MRNLETTYRSDTSAVSNRTSIYTYEEERNVEDQEEDYGFAYKATYEGGFYYGDLSTA